MHSIKLLASIFAIQHMVIAQTANDQGCTPSSSLPNAIFDLGSDTPGICTTNAGLVYSLKCTADPAIIINPEGLKGALTNITLAAQNLQPLATLAQDPSVQRLHQSCFKNVCVSIHDVPDAGQGWTAEAIHSILNDLMTLVVKAGGQEPARVVYGCGFAVSFKDGTKVDFAQGCWAPMGKEGAVKYCLLPVAAQADEGPVGGSGQPPGGAHGPVPAIMVG